MGRDTLCGTEDMEIGKVYQPTIDIQAGPNAFAQAMPLVQGNWSSWLQVGQSAYEASFDAPEQPSPVDMVKVSAWLRQRLPLQTPRCPTRSFGCCRSGFA